MSSIAETAFKVIIDDVKWVSGDEQVGYEWFADNQARAAAE